MALDLMSWLFGRKPTPPAPPEPKSEFAANALPPRHVVTAGLFGGNFVRPYHTAPGPWLETVKTLGITHARFPGGSVTEQLSEAEAVTVYAEEFRAFLAAVAPLGISVSVVVPTADFWRWQSAPSIVALVVAAVRSNPGVIRCIEIGNEAYGRTRDPAAYISAAIRWLEALSDLPPIAAVQAWPPRNPGFSPRLVVDGIPARLRPLVAGVIIHHYIGAPDSYDRPDKLGGLYTFRADLGYPLVMERFVSEWGVHENAEELGAPGDSDLTGMEIAAPLVRGFDQMVRHGVTRACLWPVSHRAPTGPMGERATAGWNFAGAPYLTPSGVAFRQMRSLLPGLARIAGTSSPAVNTFEYAGPARAVTILTNQGPEATITVEHPGRHLPVCTQSDVRQVGWAQNSLIYGTESLESGAALGTLSITPAAVGAPVTVALPQHGVAFVVAE